MKGGNTSEILGYDSENVSQYGSFDMTGGKKKGKGKKSQKFDDFDFEKEWKEFEESYNQKYGGASKKKTSSSTKKKPAKKASSSAKKPAKKTTKRKTQRGGDEAGATYAPAQTFDANSTMSSPPSGPFQSAYGTINAVGGLSRNLAPFPNSSGQLTGGAKKKKGSKSKTTTKTTKSKKDTKKKDSKKDSKKKDTKSTGKKVSVLDKIKKFFAM